MESEVKFDFLNKGAAFSSTMVLPRAEFPFTAEEPPCNKVILSVSSAGIIDRSVSPSVAEFKLNPFQRIAFCLASVPRAEIVAMPPDPYDLINTDDFKESISA